MTVCTASVATTTVDAPPGHAAVHPWRKRAPAPPPEPKEDRPLIVPVASLAPRPKPAAFVAADASCKRKRLQAAAADILIRDMLDARAAHARPAPSNTARNRLAALRRQITACEAAATAGV